MTEDTATKILRKMIGDSALNDATLNMFLSKTKDNANESVLIGNLVAKKTGDYCIENKKTFNEWLDIILYGYLNEGTTIEVIENMQAEELFNIMSENYKKSVEE